MGTPRGIRNNNPGNIEINQANKWQGVMPRERMTAEQRDEKRFVVFASPAWGIRALATLLINYFDRHGLDTINKIVNRWAPPVENDTNAYARAVARETCINEAVQGACVTPNDFVNLHEYRRLRPIVEAIIRHENGQQPYSAEVIEEGLRLAGVVKPGAEPLVAVPKAVPVAAVTAATATGAGAIAELAQQFSAPVQQLTPAIAQVNAVAASTSALPGWLRAGIAVVVLIAAGASLYTWWKLRRAKRAVAS
ncbi:hypothetical protein [Stenotrophomonas acidaminiphila]|uniref:hypothetical protein n=1 Tax=Stenotrophomonas acidaminiphila TaxID=128780 RepID=UPI0015F75EAD|nr:hypothetical protein [Stenotrophomonas acidaminiphila]